MSRIDLKAGASIVALARHALAAPALVHNTGATFSLVRGGRVTPIDPAHVSVDEEAGVFTYRPPRALHAAPYLTLDADRSDMMAAVTVDHIAVALPPKGSM